MENGPGASMAVLDREDMRQLWGGKGEEGRERRRREGGIAGGRGAP